LILGIGTDLIEVDRVAKEFARDIGFKEEIFGQSEIKYCEQKKFSAENYAARYAAKEAFFKALGSGWRYGMRFKEIEIVNDDVGKPELLLSGKAKQFTENLRVSKIHVSLSHEKKLATAFVILEK
jgi:holo-[acyl-carrier protein] synthase